MVVRHGRTEWNATGRFQGRSDVALDERGRAQARALEAALASERFDRIIASDLARARETAETIANGRDIGVETDARWREMDFGAWEGLTWPEIVERNPALSQASATAPKFFTPAGGESFDDLCARVAEALASIDARAGDGAKVLVTTHAGPLHALLRVALGESEASALGVRFSPASITRLAFRQPTNRIIELNTTLPEAAS